jgi:salicylate hydroxylase
VVILEQAKKFQPVGASIQLPANATRTMRELGLYERLEEFGAVTVQNHVMRTYDTGQILAMKAAGQTMTELYGSEWMVIYRARYHSLLRQEAIQLSAGTQSGCEVVGVNKVLSMTTVTLASDEPVSSDVVIGADGLWSQLRKAALSGPIVPAETGDLAYRGTFSAEQLHGMRDEGHRRITGRLRCPGLAGTGKACKQGNSAAFSHSIVTRRQVVFYPIKEDSQYSLVLLSVPQDGHVLELANRPLDARTTFDERTNRTGKSERNAPDL